MYLFCTAVWGLNFIAVKLQGTPIAVEFSLFYRLAGATVIFFVIAAIMRPGGAPNRRDIVSLAAFGIFNLSISYLLLYYATIWISTALVTLLFSLKTTMTPIALRIFLTEPLHRRIFIGGAIGTLGVAVLLYPTIRFEFTLAEERGIFLAVLGTLFTAVGDTFTARIANRGIDPIYTNCIGFFVASIILLFVCISSGTHFYLPDSFQYLSALLYITLFSSFAAWICYLKVVARIGAAPSSYMVALFPAVGGTASVAIGESEVTVFLVMGCLLSCLGAAISLGVGRARAGSKLSEAS